MTCSCPGGADAARLAEAVEFFQRPTRCERVEASEFAAGVAEFDFRRSGSLVVEDGAPLAIEAVHASGVTFLSVQLPNGGPVLSTFPPGASGCWLPLPDRWSGVLILEIDPSDTAPDVFVSFRRRAE